MLKLINFIAWFFRTIFWIILALLDMIPMLFFPNNRFHVWVNSFYKKHVRLGLTDRPLSTFSFTVTHGVFYFLMLIVVGAVVYAYSNKSAKIIKTKHIRVSVYSETNDSMVGLFMYLKQDWNMKPDSMYNAFQLCLQPSETHSDSAKYKVDIETNFDMNLYTGMDYSDNDDVTITDSTCSERHFTYNLLYNTKQFCDFLLSSDARILNDKETPYVNLYISFGPRGSYNAIMPQLTDSTCMDSTFRAHWESGKDHIDFLLDKWEEKDDILNQDADVMTYDIKTIKPEPISHSPFVIKYNTPEQMLDILENGVYLSIVNRNLEAKLERDAFLYSVIIGAFVSLVLTLFFDLFMRWKKINMEEGKENPFD